MDSKENAKKYNIIYKNVKELKLNPKNPRKNDCAVDTVIKSIEKYGFKNPLIIDTDGIVWCGNTRLKAAKKMGLKEVPCILADDLTEEQIREYALIDNKSNEIADWDMELLSDELSELDLSDFELDWGIEELEPEKEVEEDDFDCTPPEQPKAKLGDIYQLGNHRLMCGDSTKEEDVSKLMNGEKADLVVTDPPYNVAIENSKGLKIKNDDMENDKFLEFLTSAFNCLEKSLKPGGVFYVWFASREHINFETALNNNNLQVRQELIWNKNSLIIGRQDYQWKHEPCLYGWKEGASHYFVDDRSLTTVIEDKKPDIKKMKKEEMQKLLEEIYSDKQSTTIINEDKPSVNDLHPTMKPIKLIARQVKNSSRSGESVLDLFGGSGSTIITCEQLKRNCYMMEFDPKYVQVIIERYIAFTGKEVYRLNNDGTKTKWNDIKGDLE